MFKYMKFKDLVVMIDVIENCKYLPKTDYHSTGKVKFYYWFYVVFENYKIYKQSFEKLKNYFCKTPCNL